MTNLNNIKAKAELIELEFARPSHAEVLYRILMGVNAQRYSPVLDISVDDLRERFKEAGGSFSERAPFYRLFGKTVDGELFGTFIVKNIKWGESEAEIGFSLLDEYQGQGFGAALVYRCLMKLFSETSIDRVWSTVSVTNEAGKHLMASLDFNDRGCFDVPFMIKGKLVDQNLFDITREQFEQIIREPRSPAPPQ